MKTSNTHLCVSASSEVLDVQPSISFIHLSDSAPTELTHVTQLDSNNPDNTTDIISASSVEEDFRPQQKQITSCSSLANIFPNIINVVPPGVDTHFSSTPKQSNEFDIIDISAVTRENVFHFDNFISDQNISLCTNELSEIVSNMVLPAEKAIDCSNKNINFPPTVVDNDNIHFVASSIDEEINKNVDSENVLHDEDFSEIVSNVVLAPDIEMYHYNTNINSLPTVVDDDDNILFEASSVVEEINNNVDSKYVIHDKDSIEIVSNMVLAAEKEMDHYNTNINSSPTVVDNGNILFVASPVAEEIDENVNSEYVLSENDEDYIPLSDEVSSSSSESDELNPSICQPEETRCTKLSSLRRTPYYKKKANYCTFCKNPNLNLHRHFQTIHYEEPEVKRFAALPINCRERKKLITELRLRGNFEYNSQGDHSNEELIVARRVKNVVKNKYVPCPKCKIFLTKSCLRRHYKNFHSEDGVKSNRGITASSRAIYNDIHPLACEVLKNVIFSSFREDVIYHLIKQDRLIMVYGNFFHDMIRNRLRTMGRFLSYIKTINNKITDLTSMFHPSFYDGIIEALQYFGDMDTVSGFYRIPTLPSTLGTSIKVVGDLLITECIKSQNETKKKAVEDLQRLLLTGLQGPINKVSTESRLFQKRHKKEDLPITEDIQKLQTYLKACQTKDYKSLTENGFSVKSWISLLQHTLISILVFNRRRPGELERALLSDLDNLQTIKNPEQLSLLTEEEIRAAKYYARFTIRGKLGRGVPVLLNQENNMYLKYLIQNRSRAGVNEKNPYIFGIPHNGSSQVSQLKYLRAYNLLKKYSQNCGASNPLLLKATHLRKHVATKSALLNLDSRNVENLQNFMGHADKIHNEYYRQPIVNRDIINMSKLLEIAQGSDATTSAQSTILNETDARFLETTNIVDPEELSSEEVCSSEEVVILNEVPEAIGSPCKKRKTPSPEGTSDARSSQKRVRLTKMGFVKRTPWSSPEVQKVYEIFGEFIENNELPPLEECMDAQFAHTVLKNRSPQQIRLWIHNCITKKKRSTSVEQRSTSVVQRWTSPERRVIKEVFGSYIAPNQHKYPSFKEIREAISKYPEIGNRSPKKIKSQIQHLRKLQAKRLHF